MVFGITNNLDASTAGDHHIALRNSLGGVVSAFGLNIRTQKPHQLANIKLVKNGYCIYILQRGKDFCAFCLRCAWPAFALQSAGAGLRVHAHDQPSTQLLGGMQITDVPHVQHIKTAIGKNDFFSG